jgi:hypothetical protein
LARQT